MSGMEFQVQSGSHCRLQTCRLSRDIQVWTKHCDQDGLFHETTKEFIVSSVYTAAPGAAVFFQEKTSRSLLSMQSRDCRGYSFIWNLLHFKHSAAHLYLFGCIIKRSPSKSSLKCVPCRWENGDFIGAIKQQVSSLWLFCVCVYSGHQTIGVVGSAGQEDMCSHSSSWLVSSSKLPSRCSKLSAVIEQCGGCTYNERNLDRPYLLRAKATLLKIPNSSSEESLLAI